jgi:hypothetical protein
VKISFLGLPEYTSSDKAKALSGPLGCLKVPCNQLEIFVPGNWDGFVGSDEHFPAFLIGKNNGQTIEYTCNPAKLKNSRNDPPGAPHHMTETYLRGTVLQEFRGREDQFGVRRRADAGLIESTREGWRIELFFDLDEQGGEVVVVRLGDIGMCVPWQIRKHFRSFNFAPDSSPTVLIST